MDTPAGIADESAILPYSARPLMVLLVDDQAFVAEFIRRQIGRAHV